MIVKIKISMYIMLIGFFVTMGVSCDAGDKNSNDDTMTLGALLLYDQSNGSSSDSYGENNEVSSEIEGSEENIDVASTAMSASTSASNAAASSALGSTALIRNTLREDASTAFDFDGKYDCVVVDDSSNSLNSAILSKPGTWKVGDTYKNELTGLSGSILSVDTNGVEITNSKFTFDFSETGSDPESGIFEYGYDYEVTMTYNNCTVVSIDFNEFRDWNGGEQLPTNKGVVNSGSVTIVRHADASSKVISDTEFSISDSQKGTVTLTDFVYDDGDAISGEITDTTETNHEIVDSGSSISGWASADYDATGILNGENISLDVTYKFEIYEKY